MQDLMKDPCETKSIPMNMIEEIYHTMRHARTFIASREKMHPDGVKLYDELLETIENIITQ